jgi:interferon gamma-inducible protein 30
MQRFTVAVVVACLAMIASVGCLHLADSETDAQKVKVDLYFQTICHDSRQFIVDQVKAAQNTADFWKICDFDLYPYGNANRRKKGDEWEIICQHGPKECEGNILETCTLKLYEKYSQAIPFIICLEEGAPNWDTAGAACAAKGGLDWSKITGCASSETGHKYELEMADATESLNPQRTEVPWILINGEHSYEVNDEVQRDLVGYVCSVYKGPLKIDACQ